MISSRLSGNTGSAATSTTAAVVSPAVGNDTGGPAGQGGSLLPAGYLSTDGNQIVDSAGNPVRIASIGWSGTDSLTFAPYGLWQSSLEQNIQAIVADGFNTIRIAWTDVMLNASPEMSSTYAAYNPALDPELDGVTSMQLLQQLVQDAGDAGLKVILDHHDNDGGPGGWGGQQANGLWIDSGPGTDGTDGSGTVGTVNAATFLADSVQVAQAFAGNSTVIGFDLDNEPTSAGNINWGQGGPTDIQAMYTQVGDAIQAVDPGALIIAEGPDEWSGPAPGMPAGFAEGDLSGVGTDPVTLTIPDKVVYSVHEYPPDLSGSGSYDMATQIAAMNAGWGYLETDNIAPVWIGEMGSNMTSTADQAWIQGLLDYMNGDDGAQGGPTFSGNDQPVSGSWWQWGAATGQDPEGVETAWGSGTFWPAQQVATDQLLYTATARLVPITITPATAVLATTDAESAKPFTSVVITDANAGQTETAQVSLSATANGTLSDPNAATDGSTIANGVLTVTGSATVVATALDALVFKPTIHEVAAGASVTTTVTASITDTAGETASAASTITATGAKDNLALQISQDAWNGNAKFTVSVNGTQVGGDYSAAALHASGESSMFVLKGDWNSGVNDVQVTFINDASGSTTAEDRNLYVDSIAYNGVTYAGTTAALTGNSTDTFVVGGATATAAHPLDVLGLNLSEDAYDGNAEFVLYIDGVVVTTPKVVAALQDAHATQGFALTGALGAGNHTLGVGFVNAANGGTANTERNLYIDGITVNGASLLSGVKEQDSDGISAFTFTTTH